jgi:tetratricopeptide (TPR) repeat protein
MPDTLLEERLKRLARIAGEAAWAALEQQARQAALDFPDAYPIVHFRILALRKLDHLDEALALADRELERLGGEFHAGLMLLNWKLTLSCLTRRFEAALQAWERIGAPLFDRVWDQDFNAADLENAENVLVNLAVIHSGLGRLADGTELIEGLLDHLPCGGHNATVYSNLACLYALQRDLGNTLKHVEQARRRGKPAAFFETDSDFAAVRDAPGFLEWARRDFARPYRRSAYLEKPDGSGSFPLELALDGTTVRRRWAGRSDEQCCDSELAASHLYRAWLAEGYDAGLAVTLSPLEREWVGRLQEYLDALARRGLPAAPLPDVGAIVIEWDHGDSDVVQNIQLLAWRYDDPDAARKAFRGYLGTDENTLAEDTFLEAPRIADADSFARIVGAVGQSGAFARLRKQTPFFFAQQEHDTANEFFLELSPEA